jgi:hypothetical protein
MSPETPKKTAHVWHTRPLGKDWFYWWFSKRETDRSLETEAHREMRPRTENITSRVTSKSRPLFDYINAHKVIDKRELYV